MNDSNQKDWRLFQFLILVSLAIGLFYPLLTSKGMVELNCPFAANSVHDCPSCGLSRAWFYLYEGELELANQANSNAYKLLLLLLLQVVWRSYLLIRVDKIAYPIAMDLIVTFASIILLAGPYLKSLMFWVLRVV
ncbi:DUF2752 domain-containing protein [Carboxylicivirga sp. N1Y90]|uniref:DUF2752 domain-containing protein n=1 Tax=Carboxylicivirga fragile TaxID=3417571 RepID=UPI003D32E8EC|nr:DUF2752 domain-containing protein [Marinilabiliaceae bacterium N1Y90]